MSGAITGYMNVAQIVLYAFWVFFAGLVIYLRREDKREGYPLESDRSDRAPRVSVIGWPEPPEPKTYLLRHGQGSVQLPKGEAPAAVIPGTKASAPWPGAPLIPTGDPMRDGVGPASYPMRDDVPDLTVHGTPKVVPMRSTTDFMVEPTDPDPRGMPVVCADGNIAGTIADVWVDRAEPRILYFEVALSGADSAEEPNPLLPYCFAKVNFGSGKIVVGSIMADQFKHVPRTAKADQITRLEEDRISAYFAGGLLYAEPSRQEPLV